MKTKKDKNEYYKAYYAKNKEKILSKNKKYYETNKKSINTKGKEYVERNLEKTKKYKKEWNEKNATKKKEKFKNYYENNKEIILEKNRLYRQKNKDKINESKRKYESKKLKDNPLFKIKRNIGRAITRALKLNKIDKKQRTIIILGCSLEQFKKHIEKQFESWMTWDNYGMYIKNTERTWNIDHIIPISSAKTEEDIIKLNHFTNLRPLCSLENNIKNNNII